MQQNYSLHCHSCVLHNLCADCRSISSGSLAVCEVILKQQVSAAVCQPLLHCLISNREGLGTSIDPHSQKEHTEIHKIPKFGVNQASFD